MHRTSYSLGHDDLFVVVMFVSVRAIIVVLLVAHLQGDCAGVAREPGALGLQRVLGAGSLSGRALVLGLRHCARRDYRSEVERRRWYCT